MYKVLADGNVIYDDRVPADAGLYLVNPKLHLEDSAAGSFECDLVPNTFAYAACEGMTSIIKVLRDEEEIFEGRILSESYNFNNVRSIYCEGELAYLNDTFQPQNAYHDITVRQFIENIIRIHNCKVPPEKRFNWTPGTDPATDPLAAFICTIHDPAGDTGFRYTQYDSTLGALNKLIENFGGHMFIRKVDGVRYLHFYDEFPSDIPNQKIKYGVNLLDYSKEIDYSKICSVVLPTGGVLVSAGETKKGPEIDLTVADDQHYVPGTTRTALAHHQPEPFFLNETGEWQYDLQQYWSEYSYFYGAEVWVEEFKTYYLTCRMRGSHREQGWIGYKGNYAIYAFCREDGAVLQMKTVNVSEQAGFEDTVDLAITAPAGAKWVRICGLDYPEIQMKLYKALAPEEDLDEYITVESVNDGSLYVVNQSLVNRYGWIEKQIQWDDVQSPAELLTQAELYLSAGQFNEITYEITALDMKLLGVDCNAIRIGMTIECEDENHGIDPDAKFPVTALDIPLDSPEDMTIQLGYAKTPTLTQANNDLSDDILARIAALPSESKTLNSAKQNAAAMINNATSGYITIHQSGDGTDEIIISDSPDYLTAQNVWRWNSGGLGFSNQGYAPNQFETAITSDGAIVANFITAGQMTADRIRGGELVLGGMNNISGVMRVKGVHEDTTTDPPTYTVYENIIADKDGIQVNSWDYDWINNRPTYRAIKISDGQIKAGTWDEDNGFYDYGHIAMTYVASTSQGNMAMMDINAPVLQINCTKLWITDSQDSWNVVEVPNHSDIDVVTAVHTDSEGKVTSVDRATLVFRHGIMIIPY